MTLLKCLPFKQLTANRILEVKKVIAYAARTDTQNAF